MSIPPQPLRLGFLASHGGSNMQAILDAIAAGTLPAEPRLVICNNSGATALQRAQAAGVPGLHLSTATHGNADALDAAMLEALRDHEVNLVVCAGYMRKVGPRVLAAYRQRVVNVHPALLPRYGGAGMFGMHVHEAVLAAGERVTGVTIHLVDEVYDHGLILAQAEVPVQPGDTPQVLQARVLETEHRLYPETLRRIALGEIDLDAV
ncbi:MAG TPA: phosphoribosylglycinamide formyltransferase [bacterium]|nr:phosphoribosylglycinamide formyltransferase [bacterium]